jgi:transcriptional pleiotropic regulator of transition state genes
LRSTGIVRRTDTLGRVVIPKELRSTLNIDEKDPLEIFTEGNTIILRKYEPHCILCGQMKHLKGFREKLLCSDCIEEMRISSR